MPNAHKKYALEITAVDDLGDTSTLHHEITVISKSFVPLPEKVNVGYYHSWESTHAPFIYLEEILDTKYNVVVYSFIETENSDGFTPLLTMNKIAANYKTDGVFDEEKLLADINRLRDNGIPVLVSIGGQNGHVELDTVDKKEVFVEGVIAILNKYNFDGLDIDFEGSSMDFGAGTLTDFSYESVSNYPNLKNTIDAIREIDSEMGDGFHITAAPEVQYVQQGSTAFANKWGSFLPVIDNIRDILDYIHVQLYNIGETNGVKGIDNVNYFQGSPDLIVSATESLIHGFTTAGTGIKFNGLRADQVAIGLPATDACSDSGGAAGGGFIETSDVEKAIKYLVEGTSFDGSYTMQGGPYPNLRGAMTWSINWDKTTACGSTSYEFSNNIDATFESITLSNDEKITSSVMVCPNPVDDVLNVEWHSDEELNIAIFDFSGRRLFKTTHNFGKQPTLQLNTEAFSGILFLQLNADNQENHIKKIIIRR